MQPKQNTSIVWFTDNLRAQDNCVLKMAMTHSKQVIGVYFLDQKDFEKTQFGFKKTGKFRAKFTIETLQCLKDDLANLNISFLIFKSSTQTDFKDLIRNCDVKTIYKEKQWTNEEINCLESLKSQLSSDIQIIELFDQFLFNPEDAPFHYSETPKVFTQFRKTLEKKAAVRPIAILQAQDKSGMVKDCSVFPNLQTLGYEDFETDQRAAFVFKGGSKEALKRLEDYFFKSKGLGVYKKTRNGLLGPNYSSKFSPWLANGSLSARQIYWKVKEFEAQYYSNQSTYWLVFELIWRDFFKYVSLKHGDAIFKLDGILKKDYIWSKNPKFISQWTEGKTADDFVNANMIELKKTGWMSNRGRQNVASYFSKNLKQDWRIGAAYFESMLLDYDVHSNYGNWMYVSGVGNDPRDRIFNLERQAQMYDANKQFRNHWLKNRTLWN